MNTTHSQDYYHINRLVRWSPHGLLAVGDEIDVGGSSNPYFRVFEKAYLSYGVTQDDGNVVQVPGIRFLTLASEGRINVPNLAATAEEIARHFVGYVRELIWEDVRRSDFPHLPSRQRCVWLIPIQNGVKYWLRRLNVSQDFQVLRVRVQGCLHKASESYLLGDSEPMEETISKARQYWLGVAEEEETEEIIFEGRMRVEEVMPANFYV